MHHIRKIVCNLELGTESFLSYLLMLLPLQLSPETRGSQTQVPDAASASQLSSWLICPQVRVSAPEADSKRKQKQTEMGHRLSEYPGDLTRFTRPYQSNSKCRRPRQRSC